MLATLESAAVFGVEALPVHVEVDVSFGLPKFTLVGLPDASVRESRDRVRAAILNSGFDFPAHRITINLAPADIRKAGSAFDLPIALGVLAAGGGLQRRDIQNVVLVGELSLDGTIHSARGVLPIAAAARHRGAQALLLPLANAAEAAVVEGLRLLPVATLVEAVEVLNSPPEAWPACATPAPGSRPAHPAEDAGDLADLCGQLFARRALEVAAAGGHNLLMVGPPGSGKTMLARRLPTILPPFSFEEALECTAIHSVAGHLSPGIGLLPERPFRAPHHTISDAALVGGGTIPRPGEISLAHQGVLFLDELPEFGRRVLEALRQPLEEGQVTIARAARSVTFPARFMLVAAMNPCPCGHFGSAQRTCRCTPHQLAGYRARLSGPLRDRLDLVVEVPAVPHVDLIGNTFAETSASVRARVMTARERQRERRPRLFRGNAGLSTREMTQDCRLDAGGRALLANAAERLALSARAVHRVLRVARTIADLAEHPAITQDHLAEAVQYRMVE